MELPKISVRPCPSEDTPLFTKLLTVNISTYLKDKELLKELKLSSKEDTKMLNLQILPKLKPKLKKQKKNRLKKLLISKHLPHTLLEELLSKNSKKLSLKDPFSYLYMPLGVDTVKNSSPHSKN